MLELLSEPWPWYVAGPLIGLMVPVLHDADRLSLADMAQEIATLADAARARPIDERAVRRLEIAQEPRAVVRRELGVTPADGFVRDGQRLAAAADELRLIARQLEVLAPVGTLDDLEDEQRTVSLPAS